MAAPYVISGFNHSVSNFSTYFVVSNQLTNGLFGAFLLISWFVIIFVALKVWGTDSAMTAASVLTLIFAIFIRTAGIIGDLELYITIFLTAVILVVAYLRK